MMLDSLNHLRDGYAQIRALKLPNSVAPAFVFHPQPAAQDPLSRMREKARMAFGHHAYRTPNSLKGWTPDPAAAAPARIEDLAFATVSELASLLRARKITSARSHTDVPRPPQALRPQAALRHHAHRRARPRAGQERRRGDCRRQLSRPAARHSLGRKGSARRQRLSHHLGRGRLRAPGPSTKTPPSSSGSTQPARCWWPSSRWARWPWATSGSAGERAIPGIPAQGSSGSSAGPASAVAAGCVAFAIGSETLGSISSPSTRCGDTGLRPTFGFVPRTGAMALSWTMDKLGPICRSAEDCALVLEAIYGPDGKDTSVYPVASFDWEPRLRLEDAAHRLPEERVRPARAAAQARRSRRPTKPPKKSRSAKTQAA